MPLEGQSCRSAPPRPNSCLHLRWEVLSTRIEIFNFRCCYSRRSSSLSTTHLVDVGASSQVDLFFPGVIQWGEDHQFTLYTTGRYMFRRSRSQRTRLHGTDGAASIFGFRRHDGIFAKMFRHAWMGHGTGKLLIRWRDNSLKNMKSLRPCRLRSGSFRF
jgi:hypothetical protein